MPEGLLETLGNIVMKPAFLAREGDRYVDDRGFTLIGAPDENGMAALPVAPDGTDLPPSSYSLGPPYNEAPTPFTGTPFTPAEGSLDFSGGQAAPSNWEDFQAPNTSTGGGFFTMDNLFADTPAQFQVGSSMPSTNNWRLLPPNFRSPQFILRDGVIIDLNSAMSSPDSQREPNSYGHGRYGSGAAMGFPSAYALGHSNSIFGWPGGLGGWTGPGMGGLS